MTVTATVTADSCGLLVVSTPTPSSTDFTNKDDAEQAVGDPTTILPSSPAATSTSLCFFIGVGDAAQTLTRPTGTTLLRDYTANTNLRLVACYDDTTPGTNAAWTSTHTNSVAVAFEIKDTSFSATSAATAAKATAASTATQTQSATVAATAAPATSASTATQTFTATAVATTAPTTSASTATQGFTATSAATAAPATSAGVATQAFTVTAAATTAPATSVSLATVVEVQQPAQVLIGGGGGGVAFGQVSHKRARQDRDELRRLLEDAVAQTATVAVTTRSATVAATAVVLAFERPALLEIDRLQAELAALNAAILRIQQAAVASGRRRARDALLAAKQREQEALEARLAWQQRLIDDDELILQLLDAA
jgi:hypothetical protein